LRLGQRREAHRGEVPRPQRRLHGGGLDPGDRQQHLRRLQERHDLTSGARDHTNSPTPHWQNTAPATVIDSPHSSRLRKRRDGSWPSGSAAMQSAPSVDSGDTSTSAAPTLMLSAMPSGSPPPSFSTMEGMDGRKVG